MRWHLVNALLAWPMLLAFDTVFFPSDWTLILSYFSARRARHLL
jgi:hypothetical protein